MYPDEKVVKFISEHFIPVKSHIKERPEAFQRFKALWTPTQLITDSKGTEVYRIEGFLPVDDFLAQLKLGLGRAQFEQKNYREAEEQFRSVYQEHCQSGAAAEALYWAGVAAYKATDKSESLEKTAEALTEEYPDSEWTRKASVWSK